MPQYKTQNNKGLPVNFSLSSGKFTLLGGAEKAKDDLLFWSNFHGFRRVYAEDFPPMLWELAQKPSSYLQVFQGLILGRMTQTAQKYLPHIRLESLSLTRTEDRLGYIFAAEYSYNLEPETTYQAVTFVQS